MLDLTKEQKRAWEELVKEANCATAAGCGRGRLFHGHYKTEWEIAWRDAILAVAKEREEMKAWKERCAEAGMHHPPVPFCDCIFCIAIRDATRRRAGKEGGGSTD